MILEMKEDYKVDPEIYTLINVKKIQGAKWDRDVMPADWKSQNQKVRKKYQMLHQYLCLPSLCLHISYD